MTLHVGRSVRRQPIGELAFQPVLSLERSGPEFHGPLSHRSYTKSQNRLRPIRTAVSLRCYSDDVYGENLRGELGSNSKTTVSQETSSPCSGSKSSTSGNWEWTEELRERLPASGPGELPTEVLADLAE